MNPHDLPPLLYRLQLAGLTLRLLDCNRIEVLGSGLTDDLRQQIHELKPLLVDLLTPLEGYGACYPSPSCPKCGSSDLADGKQHRWCLTCEAKLGEAQYLAEERLAIQQEHTAPLGESLAELCRWFERREQGAGIRLLASGRISESPQVFETRGDSDPTPLVKKGAGYGQSNL